MVCEGAEKNFNRFAERLEQDGEPVVDLNHFRHVVAKAMLWRAAEQSFDAQEKLGGYRANSVAYAVAWVAEKSGHRIDLDRIWQNQCVSPFLLRVLAQVCAAAHGHILSQAGNPGEASKKAACWATFRAMPIEVDRAWESEWAAKPFQAAANEEEALALEWERVRVSFENESRTLGELEALTGRTWMATRRNEPAYTYAEMPWTRLRTEKLRGQQRLGLASIRDLVGLFSAAHGK